MPYHHGDLRRAVLDGALAAIEAHGPAALSLRDVARRAGVSHAAPAHHFGDKRGVLTAIAAEGYLRLADTTRAALEHGESFAEGGLAYIRFAVENRAYFEVMFRPDLYRAEHPDLVAARGTAAAVLADGVRGQLGADATDEEVIEGVIASWSFCHGLATLWLTHNLVATDPEQLAVTSLRTAVRLAERGAFDL